MSRSCEKINKKPKNKLSFGTILLLLPLLFAFFPTACGEGLDSDSGRKILRIGNGPEPKDLDPAIVTGLPEFHIISALLEGLVTLDPQTLEVIPAAAASWEVSEDQLIYTFQLQPDGRWSNGDKVTASDFVYSWLRLLNPSTGAEYAYMAWYIKNAKAFSTGKIKDPGKVGVRAKGSHTLVVRLEAHTPFFLPLMNHHSLYPVHRATVEKYKRRWTQPENYVGNGAFRLKKWVLNRIIEVEKNPEYWDASTVKLDEIHFYPIENENTEEKMFRTGKLDLTRTVPLERLSYWREREEYFSFPILSTYYYQINVTRGPLKDRRVRRALAYSIDRKAIVEHVTAGGEVAASAFTPPNTAGFTAEAKMPYDPKKARDLLREAGYPGGKGFPKIELLYNTMEAHRKIAQAIQQMWKKELGIEVGLFNQEWKVMLSAKQSGDYDIVRAGWRGDYLDPNTFLDLFVSWGGNNFTGWSNSEYDEIIQRAARTLNKVIRYRLFQKAEKLLFRDAPIIPIYTYSKLLLKHPRVKGYYANVMDFRPHKYLSVD